MKDILIVVLSCIALLVIRVYNYKDWVQETIDEVKDEMED